MPSTQPATLGAQAERAEAAKGVGFALAAYGFWGLNPLYFKLVDHLPMLEVLAHRVIWSILFLLLVVAALRSWRALRAAIGSRRSLAALGLTTLIISANWLIYIWAINSEQVLETSLGYYMNPLLSVVLGVVVLRERLTALQGVAVLLAAAGVLNLAIGIGEPPWISLSLALTFAVYGLIRKTIAVGSVEGLLVETTLMLPIAVGYLTFLGLAGSGSFVGEGFDNTLLLIASGAVTMLPLIWFTSAARRLRFSTVGFFQYLAPTCHFLLAVFAFGEPFTWTHMVTFALIWTAVGLYVAQSIIALRRPAAVEGTR
ncbi:MAG: EamA family transporter RarD [Kiloniellales bacterium]|nr:EamA family transporter RarD [Kiloniellales bacterium]